MGHAATDSRPTLSGRARRRLAVGTLVLCAGGGLAAGAGLLDGFLSAKPPAGDPKASGFDVTRPLDPAAGPAQAVKVIRPKRDAGVEVSVEQIATVEPYFQAQLKTRVAGVVRAVHKAIGDPVYRGEVLVEIDVPEMEQEVAQKEGVVEQRRQELKVAEVRIVNARAGVDLAKAGIRQRQAELAQATATAEFRRRRLARVSEMAGRDVVVANVVDEEEREYRAAAALVDAAEAGVERAAADLAEKESSVKAAIVDTDLKRVLVDIARRDLERTRAMIGYAKVTAPFDGVITRRNVDPGAFVQNASSGQSEPLLTVARMDLVTVVARFPDNAAPFMDDETLATVRLNELPGATVSARVTRYSPSIQNSDRTVRVEVDLFNGSRDAYDALVAHTAAAALAPLASPGPVGASVLAITARDFARGFRKGDGEGLPTWVAASGRRLLPGMGGSMKLRLSRFDDAYVVPTTAVYNRSGMRYVLLVDGGRTRQVPVRVQVDDGTVAKVSLLEPAHALGAPGTHTTAKLHDGGSAYELTGDELVVAARQLEVGDGTPVSPTPTDW